MHMFRAYSQLLLYFKTVDERTVLLGAKRLARALWKTDQH